MVTARYKCRSCSKVISALDAKASKAARNFLPVHCTEKSAVMPYEVAIDDSPLGVCYDVYVKTGPPMNHQAGDVSRLLTHT